MHWIGRSEREEGEYAKVMEKNLATRCPGPTTERGEEAMGKQDTGGKGPRVLMEAAGACFVCMRELGHLWVTILVMD